VSPRHKNPSPDPEPPKRPRGRPRKVVPPPPPPPEPPKPVPAKRGAPSKRTPEIEQAIVSALEIGGISRTKAAEAAGINRDTLAEWLKDPAFSARVTQAMGAAALRNAGFIAKNASRGSIQAQLELAKRLDPELWNPPIQIDIRVMAKQTLADAGLPIDDQYIDDFLARVDESLKKDE
jgi:hypothetical protein